MIGPRLTSVFKSRWMALLWGGMVLWSAVEFVGVAPKAADGGNGAGSTSDDQPLSNEDAAALKRAIEGQ